jgi:hypothetical protein
MYRRTGRLQTAGDLQQAEKRTKELADYRQPETNSRQRTVQKDQQTTDSRRPAADRETYRRAGR